MRTVRFALATVLIAAVAFVLAPTPNGSAGYGAALDAYAGDIVPIKKKKKRCIKRCITGINGTNYCGSGISGPVGCVKVINNQCVFEVCFLEN